MKNQKHETLYDLVKKYTDWYNGDQHSMSATCICNALIRGGIYTVELLKNAEPDDIRRIRNIGDGVRFGLIMTIKASLEEGESC